MYWDKLHSENMSPGKLGGHRTWPENPVEMRVYSWEIIYYIYIYLSIYREIIYISIYLSIYLSFYLSIIYLLYIYIYILSKWIWMNINEILSVATIEYLRVHSNLLKGDYDKCCPGYIVIWMVSTQRLGKDIPDAGVGSHSSEVQTLVKTAYAHTMLFLRGKTLGLFVFRKPKPLIELPVERVFTNP